MGPYREIRTIAFLEKQFPHIVEVPIPPKGLGKKLDQIEGWLAVRVARHDYGRWGRYRNGVDIAVWAFGSSEQADAFWIFLSQLSTSKPPATKNGHEYNNTHQTKPRFKPLVE